MLLEEKMKELQDKMPVNDPKYIAFKNLKGILGVIDSGKETLREEKTNEIIARYKCNS